MSYLLPQALWLLLVIPALVAFYIVLLRRRNKAALRYAGVERLSGAMTRGHASAVTFRRCCWSSLTLWSSRSRPSAVVTLPSTTHDHS
jgi:Ca-activated chloride channel family protein